MTQATDTTDAAGPRRDEARTTESEPDLSEDARALLSIAEEVARARSADALCVGLLARELGGRRLERCAIARVEGSMLAMVSCSTKGEVGLSEPALPLLSPADRATHTRAVPLDAPCVIAEAARTGQLVEVQDDRGLEARHGLAALALDPTLVGVPLVRDARVVGALGLRFAGEAPLDQGARAQVVALATLIAAASARLTDPRAHGASFRSEAASSLLPARLSRELAQATTELAILEHAARFVAQAFGDACIVRGLEEGALRTSAWHQPAGFDASSLEGLLDVAVDELALRALERGRALLATRPHRRWSAALPLRKRVPLESVLVAPIAMLGRLAPALIVPRVRGSAHREEDRVLLEAIAERVGLALASTRALSAERAVREQAERLAKSRAMRLSTVSHELRAPLTTVHLASAILRDELPDPAAFDDVLGRIGRATGRMKRLVDDLLDLGELETGRLRVSRRRVPLQRVIAQTVDELAPRARRVGKTLSCAPHPPLEIEADTERLEQILVNLVVNAIEHTPPGTWVSVGATQERDRALLWVEDGGPGIDPQLMEVAFEPHVRGGDAKSAGAGLGLWIAKGLAEAHGGELRVTRASGGGARFELSLPLAPS